MTGRGQEKSGNLMHFAFRRSKCNLKGKNQSESFIRMSGKVKIFREFGDEETMKILL